MGSSVPASRMGALRKRCDEADRSAGLVGEQAEPDRDGGGGRLPSRSPALILIYPRNLVNSFAPRTVGEMLPSS